MSATTRNSTTLRRPLGRRSSRSARARGGFTSVGTLMLIVIGIATLMLVVNWTYLVLVNRHTFRLTDNLALSAVQQLLDEGRLEDVPEYDQQDDISDANFAIVKPATGLLDQNNLAVGKRLRPTLDDLNIAAGRIDDASQPIGGANAFALPQAGEPFNTLRVEVLRQPNGLNPVQLLLRGFGSPEAARIHSASYATLDSRAIGFRPTATTRAPVTPFALQDAAWFSERVTGGSDSNNNQRRELDFVLKTSNGEEQNNAALVSLNSLEPLDAAIIPTLIRNGYTPADVGTSGLIGPATAGSPLSVDADANTPPNANAIAQAFNEVAASNDPRRAFPIYSTSSNDTVDLVGFIGARILNAAVTSSDEGQQLRVRLEPEFIVHSTLATRREVAGLSVPENLYLHKIRLTR